METAEREFAEVQNKLHRDKLKLERAQAKGVNIQNVSELESTKNDGSEDIYSVEDIYSRDQMNQQQRRFGSPEYAVRNNSMMYELPTNNLEQVKPGVELKKWDNPLKGEKYEENPIHEFEIDVTATEDQYDFYEDFGQASNLKISPIQENSQEKDDELGTEEINSYDSKSDEEQSKDDLSPKKLHLKVQKPKMSKPNQKKFDISNRKLSIKVHNFENILDATELLMTKEPMTARCKLFPYPTLIFIDMAKKTIKPEISNKKFGKLQTPRLNKETTSAIGEINQQRIQQNMMLKRSNTLE